MYWYMYLCVYVFIYMYLCVYVFIYMYLCIYHYIYIYVELLYVSYFYLTYLTSSTYHPSTRQWTTVQSQRKKWGHEVANNIIVHNLLLMFEPCDFPFLIAFHGHLQDYFFDCSMRWLTNWLRGSLSTTNHVRIQHS